MSITTVTYTVDVSNTSVTAEQFSEIVEDLECPDSVTVRSKTTDQTVIVQAKGIALELDLFESTLRDSLPTGTTIAGDVETNTDPIEFETPLN